MLRFRQILGLVALLLGVLGLGGALTHLEIVGALLPPPPVFFFSLALWGGWLVTTALVCLGMVLGKNHPMVNIASVAFFLVFVLINFITSPGKRALTSIEPNTTLVLVWLLVWMGITLSRSLDPTGRRTL
jgi:hypothetical protein